MLTEIPRVKQESGGGYRRWFEGGGIELIVWYDARTLPVGFQLCYAGDDQEEHALTWRPDRGFDHARVDAGESRPDKNQTPILIKNGPVPWNQIRDQFLKCSATLEPALRDYVLTALKRGL